MDLALLTNHFRICLQSGQQLIKKRSSLHSYEPFTLFRTITKSPHADLQALEVFLSQNALKLTRMSPMNFQHLTSFKIVGQEDDSTDKILQDGIKALLNIWGVDGSINFEQFGYLIAGTQLLPAPSANPSFEAKRAIFEFIEAEIQELLNIECSKTVVGVAYNNMHDLFEQLTGGNKLELSHIKNLFMSAGTKLSEAQVEGLTIRIKLPMTQDNFVQQFKKASPNIKVNTMSTPSKIYYSSANKSRKRDDPVTPNAKGAAAVDARFSSFSFNTPQAKASPRQDLSSTRLSKGEKISRFRQQFVAISQFSQERDSETQLLSGVLRLEEDFNADKHRLCLRGDFDIDLAYRCHGKAFEKVLNEVYGTCNFTSFVRFVVPRDYSHRYTVFVRYVSNISEETSKLLLDLIDGYHNKQASIKQLLIGVDNQLWFRSYCDPANESFDRNKLLDYFTQREAQVLWQRFDPQFTGFIELSQFK